MKNKNAMLIFLIIILTLIIVGICVFIVHCKTSQKNDIIRYKLTYYESAIPGSKSDINIYEDKVEIITTQFCSAVDCTESNPEKKTFSYSKENMDKLEAFINDNLVINSKDIIKLEDAELDEYQKEVIHGLLLGEYFFEVNIEEYKYKIEYSEDNLSYVIYFKNDEAILVKKLEIGSDYNIDKIDTYSLEFSKENLDIINHYIKNEVKNENDNIIYKDSILRKDERFIVNSIIKNDESYLDDIDDNVKLSYTVTYHGMNCPTPSLYLYNDDTYEYYYTFSTNDEMLTPKTGTYDYDVTRIINNIDKYAENSIGPYYIKDINGNKYVTYNTNTELRELLDSLNITLEKCLEQQ